jgi:uncharacterized protein (TIGR02246 family)
MSDDERAIRELVEAWFAATMNGDIETVLGLMTEDVIFMVPGKEPFGRQAFAEASKGMTDVRIDGKSEIAEIKVLGDWAYLRNHIDLKMTPPGGVPMHRAGYTLTILRKQPDGKWRLSRDANLLVEVL